MKTKIQHLAPGVQAKSTPHRWAVQNLKSNIQTHPQAGLILLAFFILATIYSLVTPPFEAGDESRHYAVVKFMADTGRLPVQEPGEAQIHWSHEGNQPPLYYALAAALTFWISTGDWNDVYWYNPHTTIGNPLRPDNKNITIHPPSEAWPWRGHVLAVHLIRFLSIVMATVTVATGYAIALSLFQGNRWLAAGAMAITAFNPMFIFISSSVNNDNAVIMFVTLTLWLMVRLGEDATRSRRGGEDARTRGREFQITDHLKNSPRFATIHHYSSRSAHRPGRAQQTLCPGSVTPGRIALSVAGLPKRPPTADRRPPLSR